MCLKFNLLLILFLLCYIRSCTYNHLTCIYPYKLGKSYFKPQTWLSIILLHRSYVFSCIIRKIIISINIIALSIINIFFKGLLYIFFCRYKNILHTFFYCIFNLLRLSRHLILKQNIACSSITYNNTWTYVIKNIL